VLELAILKLTILKLTILKLIIVGPQRGLDHIQVAAQDAVLIEAYNGIEVGAQLCDQLVAIALRALYRLCGFGIEPPLKEPDEIARYGRIGRQRSFHVYLADRYP